MEFTDNLGRPSMVVDTSAAGQRLQRFASHAFREQLGRTANGLHSNAAHAAHATPCLVDGERRPGRWELRAGELVTLELGAVADDDAPPPQRGSRPRMALRDDAGAGTTAGSSAAFTAYFRAQRLCASDEAWAAVEAAFARPLPLCVRVSHSSSTCRLAVAALREIWGDRLERVEWAPGAWRLRPAAAADDGVGDAAAIEQLQSLMAFGEVQLQEAAAMLPALALRPTCGHRVLDLCAAPGGKSLALLDAMGTPAGAAAGGDAPGVLVSNDVQRDRQERTLRRARALACAPLLATACDAATFPELWLAPAAPGGATEALRYDRVLCDVPCDGSGTLRKSPEKWGKWGVRAGLRHHPTQLAILRRGVALLRAGGALVYSTCSLDPVQDEAVVLAALAADPSLELLAPDDAFDAETLRHLRWTPGLRRWRVAHPDFDASNGEMFDRWEDVPAALRATDGGDGVALHPTMFPPVTDDDAPPLDRCVRLLPTDDDCGGFFVAVLRRRAADGGGGGGQPGAAAQGEAATPPARWLAPPPDTVLVELHKFFGLPPGAMPPLVEGARDGTGAPLLLCRVPALAERLLAPTDGVELLGGGLPVFARVPAAASWWSGPRWRVCQEAAADLALAALSSPCPRRVLFARSRAAATELIGAADRRTPFARLDELVEEGEVGGLQPGCCVTGTNVVMQGPVIVAFREDPAVFSGALLGVSALLDGDGLVVLAGDDVLARLRQVLAIAK